MTFKRKAFENMVGKGENAGKQDFLLVQQYFLPFPKQIYMFQLHSFCCLQMLSFLTSHPYNSSSGSACFLTLSQMTNFRLFQSERVFSGQFEILGK